MSNKDILSDYEWASKLEILWLILQQLWMMFFESLLESDLDVRYSPENILQQ